MVIGKRVIGFVSNRFDSGFLPGPTTTSFYPPTTNLFTTNDQPKQPKYRQKQPSNLLIALNIK
jgi:hypothetical protein